MTTSGMGQLTRRVDHCLLVGDVTTLPVVPEGWLAVLVDPALEVSADDLVEPVRAAVRTGTDEVLLLAPGPLGAALARALGGAVVAPDGPVIQTPGGVLVTTDIAGGWWRHHPGQRPEPLGARWPAPDWQDLVPPATPWPPTVIAQPVPSGWLLAPGPVSAAAAVDGVEFAVAVDPERPRLLLDPALTGELLAAAMAALPTRVRRVADLVPLAPGQGAGRAVAATAAGLLDEPVHLVNGVPLHTPTGQITVFALDAHRRPVWAEPAWLLRLTPDGAEEIVASSPPHASLRPLDPATYAMDMGWQVRLGGGGIHAFPGPPPPPAKGRASLADARQARPDGGPLEVVAAVPTPVPETGTPTGGSYRVVVGATGEPIDDMVWPPLSAMFTALLTDIPATVDLVVAGTSSTWGEAAERELAERHPGGGTASPRDFQRAGLLTMPAIVAPTDPPAAARRARNGTALLVAAGVAVLLLLVAGAVTLLQRGGDTTGLAAATDPRGTTVVDLGPGPSQPAPSSAGASPRRSASPSASPRGSLSAQPSTTVPLAPVSSPPPRPLEGTADLAVGRPTSESSHTDVYGSSRVTDGDPMSYWESPQAGMPHWVQIDLGSPAAVRHVVLRLPPSAAWPTRTENMTVLGSPDGSGFTSLTSCSCRFDPATGNRTTVNVSSGQWRYVRILVSANSTSSTGGQLSSVELYLD